MSNIDPKIASLRGTIAANTRCASPDYDGQQATRSATDAYWAKLEAEVDPEGKLGKDERRRKATNLWKARMASARLKKRQTTKRKKGKGARRDEDAA